MKTHVSESGDCPNTVIPCPFKDAGCDCKIQRHQLQTHLTDSVVEHQLKQQLKISQQQQMISKLQSENTELKQMLEETNLLYSVKRSRCGPDLFMLSTCGRALLRVESNQSKTEFESTPFQAHYSGYKPCFVVDFSSETKPDHLLVYLKFSENHCHGLVTWPFELPHTITLVDQQDDHSNICKTIEPDKLSVSLKGGRFDLSPFPFRHTLSVVEHTMLCVPLKTLSTRSYTKNGAIIVTVEVHNNNSMKTTKRMF
jgi:hypothetical protein